MTGGATVDAVTRVRVRPQGMSLCDAPLRFLEDLAVLGVAEFLFAYEHRSSYSQEFIVQLQAVMPSAVDGQAIA